MRRFSACHSAISIYWHGTLIGDAILATVAIRTSSYSISVAGVVRISIALRIRISAIVVTIRIRTSVAAVVAIITVSTVGIARSSAVTACGESRNQDSAKGYCHFFTVNRFHLSSLQFTKRFLSTLRFSSPPLVSRSVLPRLFDQCRRRRSDVRGIGRNRRFGRSLPRSSQSIPDDSR